MYDFFRGVVVNVDTADRLSFDVNGVGYLLRISKNTRAVLPLDGKPCTVYVRLVVRDDDLILFGFHDVAERVCFDLLTSVQNVGPTMTMSILGAMSPAVLRATIEGRNAKNLSMIKGVGPKSAERIILDLAGKIDRIPVEYVVPVTSTAVAASAEARELARRGLVALGFPVQNSAAAITKVCADGKLSTPDEILRAALAVLR